MRGEPAPLGTERKAKNGYWYVKVKERGWVLKHWLIWEKTHGRRIEPSKETVRFADGDNQNMTPSNIVVIPKGTSTPRKRIAYIEARIAELLAEKEYWQSQLTS